MLVFLLGNSKGPLWFGSLASILWPINDCLFVQFCLCHFFRLLVLSCSRHIALAPALTTPCHHRNGASLVGLTCHGPAPGSSGLSGHHPGVGASDDRVGRVAPRCSRQQAWLPCWQEAGPASKGAAETVPRTPLCAPLPLCPQAASFRPAPCLGSCPRFCRLILSSWLAEQTTSS